MAPPPQEVISPATSEPLEVAEFVPPVASGNVPPRMSPPSVSPMGMHQFEEVSATVEPNPSQVRLAALLDGDGLAQADTDPVPPVVTPPVPVVPNPVPVVPVVPSPVPVVTPPAVPIPVPVVPIPVPVLGDHDHVLLQEMVNTTDPAVKVELQEQVIDQQVQQADQVSDDLDAIIAELRRQKGLPPKEEVPVAADPAPAPP